MTENILIELISILGQLLEGLELLFTNFSPGLNFFLVGLFFVSIISLIFWIVSKSGVYMVASTK